MVLKKFCAAAALAITMTGSAFASDGVLPSADAVFIKWGEVEGWNIYIDTGKGTCLVEKSDENGNVVQMGLTADRAFGYFGVFTQADIDIKDNKIYMLLDETPYVAETTAKRKELAAGYKGGYLLTNNPDFVEDVMKSYNMIVMPEDEFAFVVSLDGTFKAIEAARECTAEQSS